MAAAKSESGSSPEKLEVNRLQAEWLASESGLSVKKLVGMPIDKAHERLYPIIDPRLLCFRRVCGRVVRKDPVSGEYWGVPNATVHVEDTDGSFLGFFPDGGLYFWLWPLHVRREEVAHVRTDSCGNFCVWIPRWDIDRVLRLRRERVCFPDLFRPSIQDVLERLRPRPPWPPWPIPEPDPPPPFPPIDPETLRLVQHSVGEAEAQRLASLAEARAFGQHTGELAEQLAGPAFPHPVPPPLSGEDGERLREMKLSIAPELKRLEVKKLEVDTYCGPFLRCVDILSLEWQTVLDVPDITFRVTQDVDGDGDEENVYSEGFFDVRWNAGDIGPVTLVASPEALASPVCGAPGEAHECEDRPALYTVGPMPLAPEYHDSDTGYALRVNRPKDDKCTSLDPARTPYARWLALFACHRLEGATHQRVLFQSGEVGPAPLWVPTWHAPTTPGQPTPTVPFTQDAEGWIEIQSAETLAFPDWILLWPTRQAGNYTLRVECKDGDGNQVGEASASKAFAFDSRTCKLDIDAEWIERPSGNRGSLPESCPVIRRKPGGTVELTVSWSAISPSFRSARLSLIGCDRRGIQPELSSEDRERPCHSSVFEWHNSVYDMRGEGKPKFVLGADMRDGAYRFELVGVTRGFHPRFDPGPTRDFFYDPAHVVNRLVRPFALVTEP